jgi:cysteine desulfurase / selenocysteine lyase
MFLGNNFMTAVKEMSSFDVNKIREDFPVLSQTVNGKPLRYLDNAASSQVPQVVIDRGAKYLREEHSNIHRGVHYLSQNATTAYEAAREKVKRFINAPNAKECVFVRGCTEGVNLVAYSYGRKFVNEGDEIIISQMEHHANIIPWQVLAEEKAAKLRVIPMNERGELIVEEYENMLNERTRIIAV